ncbi:flagellar motor switch protein FliG [Anaerobranca californiensis DSM 14826]|jgi:flagellar motor switch protein FliG|uniref:Flagellar motor switch protein FliG n=1 Tax=Anaerobranca californiensis DSM 14826 TaxID=1120989 RepID=A0A1M6KJB8_9FIRM|nr:flagellar motor switch protein FliG [Anaerobranca californiensis]SHJ59064.1 flagellar motor switch protein FliG [Anaerobranca californiensis DSM 14826]
MLRQQGISGKKKAAILLISLGPEVSAEIFKHLTDEEIEQLTLEIANARKISNEERDAILQEFQELCMAQEFITQGGIQYAKEVLERALGNQKALDIISRLTATLQVKPFDFVRKADPQQLLNYLSNEHPQTIALVLSFLQPEQAAIVLSGLSPEKQSDIVRRIAQMDRTSPEVIREVEGILEQKLSSLSNQDYTRAGGIDVIVDIINKVDRGTEKTIFENLEIEDPELAEEIRRKMFVFDDIILLDDRSVQRVLREVSNQELALSLKIAPEQVSSKIFKNMSKRQAELIKEEMEYMGPVRLRDIEEAQQKIVNLIRKLEDTGEIIIARGGGGDEIIV